MVARIHEGVSKCEKEGDRVSEVERGRKEKINVCPIPLYKNKIHRNPRDARNVDTCVYLCVCASGVGKYQYLTMFWYSRYPLYRQNSKGLEK